jgi:cob(I)alamin adenosyltransferase
MFTGEEKSKRLVEMADLVTEMKKIKHPFDKGVKAVKGLDY